MPSLSRPAVRGSEIARTLRQLFKFAIVGLVGLLSPRSVLYAARRPFGLYGLNRPAKKIVHPFDVAGFAQVDDKNNQWQRS